MTVLLAIGVWFLGVFAALIAYVALRLWFGAVLALIGFTGILTAFFCGAVQLV